MIRINLLPVRQARKREYGRQQLVLFFFLIVLEVVVLYMVYGSKQEEFTELEQDITEKQAQIAQVDEIRDQIDGIDRELNRIHSESEMVRDLEANRIGPGAMLDDLKFILNNPSNTEDEREHVARRFGPNDPEQVWVDSLTITPNNFAMAGTALTPDAIAELMFRLETAPPELRGFFIDPDLADWRTERDSLFGRVWSFEINGRVRFQRMQQQ